MKIDEESLLQAVDQLHNENRMLRQKYDELLLVMKDLQEEKEGVLRDRIRRAMPFVVAACHHTHSGYTANTAVRAARDILKGKHDKK